MDQTGEPDILLGLRHDGNTLTLRIDRDAGLRREAELPVVDLILFGCRETLDAETVLRGAIDQRLTYTVEKHAQGKEIVLRLPDQGWEWRSACSGVIEVGSDYTLADWTQKCRRLLRQEGVQRQAAEQSGRRLRQLTEALRKEATYGLERARRQRLLLGPTSPEKAELLQAQMDMYQRIADLVKPAEGADGGGQT